MRWGMALVTSVRARRGLSPANPLGGLSIRDGMVSAVRDQGRGRRLDQEVRMRCAALLLGLMVACAPPPSALQRDRERGRDRDTEEQDLGKTPGSGATGSASNDGS